MIASRLSSLIVRRYCTTGLRSVSTVSSSTGFNNWNKRLTVTQQTGRNFSEKSEDKVVLASDAYKNSCYSAIEFTISEEDMVYDFVQKISAFDIGAMVVVDAQGNITGMISERDYVTKIALLGRTSKETKVKEIATRTASLISAAPDETIASCMQKMLDKDIRHLPILDEKKKILGLVSIKDLVRSVLAEKEKTINVLSDFALGKGAYYGSE